MNDKVLIIGLIMQCAGMFACGIGNAQNAAGANLEQELAKLKEEYQQVLLDRNNLRSQMQILLQYKQQILQAQQQMAAVEQERAQWELDRDSLKNHNKKLFDEAGLVKEKVAILQTEIMKLEDEKTELRSLLAQSKAGYIVVDDLKGKIKERDNEITRLQLKVERMQDQIEVLNKKNAEVNAQQEALRDQLQESDTKYKQSLAQNKKLEKRVEQLPKEYAEVARENKILLKRTGLMHYNLGVFYTQNKEYARAIAEFEKAIELNPDDAQAYFNLGYIYAEFYVDRGKAIDNFRSYLRLAKKEDKDVDWVQKYILTWQTWEGKSK